MPAGHGEGYRSQGGACGSPLPTAQPLYPHCLRNNEALNAFLPAGSPAAGSGCSPGSWLAQAGLGTGPTEAEFGVEHSADGLGRGWVEPSLRPPGAPEKPCRGQRRGC